MNKIFDKYEWLLFDLDNTLLDFSNTSNKAFYDTFSHFGIDANEQDHQNYYKINGRYWHYFEQQNITADELKYNRFKEFLNHQEWRLDEMEVSQKYMDFLVDHSTWLDDAEAMFHEFSKSHKIAIITNGLLQVQQGRLKKHDINHKCFVSEELGISKPHQDYFQHVFEGIYKPSKKDVLVIGDNPIADIKGGSTFGFDTCFFNHKKLKKKPKEADYVIDKW